MSKVVYTELKKCLCGALFAYACIANIKYIHVNVFACEVTEINRY